MRSKPKKSLGQNFLFDKNIQNKIIDACELKKEDCVLEIGSGRGELTQLIAPCVNSLVAVEIDKELCLELKNKFKECRNVRIINRDILKLNLDSYFKKNKLKVIGNIPYYISTPIITRLLKSKKEIGIIYLTIQKELARRLTADARSKNYGAISCFINYHSDAKILFNIKRNSFFPTPKVDSCFLRLIVKDLNFVVNEARLFKIIRSSFNKRRKTLRNSLKEIVPKEKLEGFFRKYSINPNIRPQELSLEEFIKLANE